MRRYILLFSILLSAMFLRAQDERSFYATMALHDAYALQNELPADIFILDRKGNEAVVSITSYASQQLQGRILMHGPGYIYYPTLESGIEALHTPRPVRDHNRISFSISEDVLVNQALDLVEEQNIEDHMITLEDYGTRYHDRPPAIQSAVDLKAFWEDMAAQYGRSDVSVRLYNHGNTPMPSVILTIQGSQLPDEYVIVGAHLDSTSNQGNNDAPGSDDDASGVASITEAVRVLLETGFVPQRTVEVMAYAAEEIGLVGSNEIAQDYSAANVEVVAYVQFDMTNYQGSGADVYFITDYTSTSLNTFLMDLMDHYNSSGPHAFTYGTTLCNYGCSDHASWHNQGYMAAFPFESSFGQHNPNIHSPWDTFDFIGTAEHAAKFTKLCVEFIAETAKNDSQLGTATHTLDFGIYTDNDFLYYRFDPAVTIETLTFFDMVGNRTAQLQRPDSRGMMDLRALSSGIYLVVVRTLRSGTVSRKIVVR